MRKLLITLILFFNMSLCYQEGSLRLSGGAEVHAQQRVDCPPDPNGGGGGGFWNWLGGAIGAIGDGLSSIGNAIGNVASSIGNFFGNLFGGSEGEGPGEEPGESDYGYDGDNGTFDGSWPSDGGDPGQNVWNDPYFDSDNWGSDEWWLVDNMGTYVETYNNGSDYNTTTYQTWAGEFSEKLDNPATSNFTKSNLPCYNSFLLSSKKIIHFTPEQLAFIQSFHFDGNNLEYFIDVNGYKFILGQTPTIQNNIIVSTTATFQFISIDRIKQDIAHLTTAYGTTVRQLQDINGNTRDLVNRAPVNNLNYCFKIDPGQVEDCGAGKMVEARTSDGTPYCKTLKPEDCARGMGRKRDDYLPWGGINLHHHVNMPDAVRQFLQKILGNIAGPCTISFINSKLNELHNSSGYQNAGSEALKEEMEYLTVGYYYVMGALYCATNEEAAKGKLPAAQFALGALHEVVNSIDVVQLTEGLILVAKGMANLVDQNVAVLRSILDQMITDVITNGSVDYENIFKKIVEAATSQLNGAYDKIKQICSHLAKIYFTECDQYQFGDGSVGDICAYRRGEMAVMALPIIISGGQWAVVKATSLTSKYLARTGKAMKLMDEAIVAGASITDDAGRIVVHEAADEVSTVITKEADDIHFKRDNNEFDPHPPTEVNVPTINGRKPVNYEFAGRTYHTTSGFDVPFNMHGFPDFDQFSARTVRIDGMAGNYTTDFAKANKAAFGVEDANYHLTHGYGDYTWHHHEDTKSMMLVPKTVNNPAQGGVAHTGGAAVVKHNNLLPSGSTPLTYSSPPLK